MQKTSWRYLRKFIYKQRVSPVKRSTLLHNGVLVMFKSSLSASAVASAILLTGLPLAAQVTSTSIVGTVTDTTSAAVPNATVTVTDLDRNQVKKVQSNAQGAYRVDFLQPGNYQLEVELPGFKRYVQKGIVLNVGVPATLDVALNPGEVAESIEVTSAAPLVNTTNAEIGSTIDKQEIVELPLVNRNAYALLDLTPGVQTNSQTTSFGAPAQRTLINGGQDNGSGSANYFLDGAPNMTGLNNIGNSLPNPDALQEFRVQTSNYGAPYGRFASGVINAIVRSGTNTVHGSAFEFIRNTALNARNWGSSPTLPKAPLHRNQFGATVGGPIFRDKTFFFGSYAGLRQTSATFFNSAVLPTAAELSGDFRNSAVKPVDPLTNAPFVCNGVTNVICSTRQDPTAIRLAAAFLPTANTTIGSSPAWQGYFNAPNNTDDFLIKINHTLTPTQQLSATYFNTSGYTTGPGGSSNVPYAAQASFYRQQNAVLNHTWSATAAIVNNVWLSYTRILSNRENTPLQSLADFGSAYTLQGPASLPNIAVTGYYTWGNSNSGPGYTNNLAARDLVTWTHGNHTLQFGGEAVLDKSQKRANLTNFGSFSFSGVMTKNAFADYLIGIPSSLEQDAPANVSAVTLTTSLFFQDDYRVNRNLTLNLGLRYDVQTPPVDTANRESTFIAGQQSTVRPDAPKGLLFPGDKGVARGITPVRYGHVSPRLGFAYDPTGKGRTSIRGGAGIFWGSVSEESWMASGNTLPFAIRYTFPNNSSVTGATLTNPYRNLPSGNIFPYTGAFFPVGGPVQPTGTNVDWPYTYQTNLSIQQQITDALSMSVSYVGSSSHNQQIAPDLNYPTLSSQPGFAAGVSGCTSPTAVATVSNYQCRRPFQPFGTVYQLQSNTNANYNSLQTTVTQRMSHHLSINANYVWSKSLSGAGLQSSGPSGSTIQDPNNLRAEKGRTDNDYRHIAAIGLVYQPSYYSGSSLLMRNVLNGWEISPLARFHSGSPFTIANSIDANLDGNANDRASVVADPNLGGHSLTRWFNTAAFVQNRAVNGAPVDGNSPRNFVTGPAFHSVDLNLARTFALADRLQFQFRAEATNAFNIVSYSNPGATIATSTFGQVRTANTSRQIQFGGKFIF
jgi:hypothetical protein